MAHLCRIETLKNKFKEATHNSCSIFPSSPFNVTTPCGTFRDCSSLDDGGHPDLDFDCHWYYVCSYGILYSHHKCATGN